MAACSFALSSSLCAGLRVVLRGLQGPLADKLNGSEGVLRNLDKQSGRWVVNIDGIGHKKIKSENVIPLKTSGADTSGTQFHHLSPRSHVRRMCRFGNSCWRPNCHFCHADEEGRRQRWACFWTEPRSQLDQPINAVTEQTDEKLQIGTASLPSVNNITARVDEIENRLKEALAGIEARAEKQMKKLDTFYDEKFQEIEDMSYASDGIKSSQIECDFDQFTQAYARKHSELEQRLSSLSGEVANASLHSCVAQIQEDLCQHIDSKFDARINELMLGALRKAIEPLAATVAERMVRVELQVNKLCASNDSDNDQSG